MDLYTYFFVDILIFLNNPVNSDLWSWGENKPTWFFPDYGAFSVQARRRKCKQVGSVYLSAGKCYLVTIRGDGESKGG